MITQSISHYYIVDHFSCFPLKKENLTLLAKFAYQSMFTLQHSNAEITELTNKSRWLERQKIILNLKHALGKKHWYGPLKAQAFADSGVMDAHRSQRWCPWFNSLFNFNDTGVKTHRENTGDLFLHNTLLTRQRLNDELLKEGVDGWTDGCMDK